MRARVSLPVNILAIDTSTESCSAALRAGDAELERFEIAPRRHAELILPMVDSLLAESGLQLRDLDALAFACGPGAFTGVRIAAGVIQGLAFAGDLPVVPVSSLAGLAQSAAGESELIMSAFDARMGEIYAGFYRACDDGTVRAVVPDQVVKPDTVEVPEGKPWIGLGTGWQSYGPILRDRFRGRLDRYDGERYPRAADLLPLALREFTAGNTVPADAAQPVYLRNRVTSQIA